MTKLTSRDILWILRDFKLADSENVPRNVENLKVMMPSRHNTMASFRFLKQQYYVLIDDTADDDVDYVINQIKKIKSDTSGRLLEGPKDETTYALPYKGKACYLYQITSEKKRLDSELAAKYPENSRSTWQKYIKAGHISVNGKVVDSPKYEITDADDIAISVPERPDYSENEFPIIYIDDNVIVVNKPSGVLTHSKGVLNEEFTMADFFGRYSTYNSDTNRPGIVHRLDRDTSGVIIGARNAEAATLLQKQFADRKTKKVYYAILDGRPKLDKANIDLPIARNPTAPSTFRVDSNGKSATTSYEVIDTNEKLSLVRLQPHTGRTHQLRVHMKYMNTPILGDKVYGKPGERLYLHASSLEVTIPNGNRKVFHVPMPAEFKKYFPNIKENE